MLHGDVLMADLDVDQWRNAQHLLLRSAKGARRIVCLLEKGEVVKCRHTHGADVADTPSRVDDLQAAADALYAANREPADQTLGLQWKLGASHDEVVAAAEALVTPDSSVVLAVHDAGALWTSLILRFDEDRKVISIGTADPSLVDIHGDRAEVTQRLVTFANGREGNVKLVVSCTKEAAERFLEAQDKAAVVAELGDDFSVERIG